ncbi:LOW QUALITY PROTEIN: Hypothetical protein PHPALM_185 [Phytophthora palmivora]|uniref:PiggyBac transposable element-derived protein domain-containing protein n=1 Tax=Phytophthora palmivora TaxID=4796 RepID=A0A2P4YVH9_9STRA|nr:LOW QUALITY PROTEIN: Hypothetical protein PHPALM_185 [Phytophthora palmivora]
MKTDQSQCEASGTNHGKCPKLVSYYRRWMGGWRAWLQSYSIQRSIRFQTYYKLLFLGFLDMAVVNEFTTHNEACRIKGTSPMPRGRLRPKRRRQTLHTHLRFDDWDMVSGVRKRRRRTCIVCAFLREDTKKSCQTIYFCDDCSNGEAKCFCTQKHFASTME